MSDNDSFQINININDKNNNVNNTANDNHIDHDVNNDNTNKDDNNNNTNNDTQENGTEQTKNDKKNTIKYENIDVTKITVDNRPLRIYLDGVFDLTHFGHYRLFKAVKDKFPNSSIIVGVSSDEETIRLKGQTLMNEQERAESIQHCKWVDEVICPCPWIVTQEFLDKHNIDYVAHDGLPYASGDDSDIYDFVKKQGRFIATQRTEGISTTDLINRIVKRYNEFVLRNLDRGVSRSDLNVSWTREKRIQIGATIDKGKEKVLEVGKKGLEFVDNVQEWVKEPSLFVDSFLNTFGPSGHITTKIKEKAQQMKDEFTEYAINAPM